jgi:uncharacterized membrane protein
MRFWTSKIELVPDSYRYSNGVMETKKGKYDTNPLDPDYVRSTEDIWGDSGDTGANTQDVGGRATRQVSQPGSDSARENVYSEAPTRRIDNPSLDAPYPSIFVQPPTHVPPAQVYQPPATAYQPPPAVQNPGSRPVANVGLPEKWMVTLVYAPFYIAVVVSLLELFFVPRKEVRVRFHAAQSLALNIAILAIQTLFSVVGAITDSSVGGVLFKIAATVFLIISMVRVWKGEPHRIAPLAEPTQWLNEKIEPRTK